MSLSRRLSGIQRQSSSHRKTADIHRLRQRGESHDRSMGPKSESKQSGSADEWLTQQLQTLSSPTDRLIKRRSSTTAQLFRRAQQPVQPPVSVTKPSSAGRTVSVVEPSSAQPSRDSRWRPSSRQTATPTEQLTAPTDGTDSRIQQQNNSVANMNDSVGLQSTVANSQVDQPLTRLIGRPPRHAVASRRRPKHSNGDKYQPIARLSAAGSRPLVSAEQQPASVPEVPAPELPAVTSGRTSRPDTASMSQPRNQHDKNQQSPALDRHAPRVQSLEEQLLVESQTAEPVTQSTARQPSGPQSTVSGSSVTDNEIPTQQRPPTQQPTVSRPAGNRRQPLSRNIAEGWSTAIDSIANQTYRQKDRIATDIESSETEQTTTESETPSTAGSVTRTFGTVAAASVRRERNETDGSYLINRSAATGDQPIEAASLKPTSRPHPSDFDSPDSTTYRTARQPSAAESLSGGRRAESHQLPLGTRQNNRGKSADGLGLKQLQTARTANTASGPEGLIEASQSRVVQRLARWQPTVDRSTTLPSVRRQQSTSQRLESPATRPATAAEVTEAPIHTDGLHHRPATRSSTVPSLGMTPSVRSERRTEPRDDENRKNQLSGGANRVASRSTVLDHSESPISTVRQLQSPADDQPQGKRARRLRIQPTLGQSTAAQSTSVQLTASESTAKQPIQPQQPRSSVAQRAAESESDDVTKAVTEFTWPSQLTRPFGSRLTMASAIAGVHRDHNSGIELPKRLDRDPKRRGSLSSETRSDRTPRTEQSSIGETHRGASSVDRRGTTSGPAGQDRRQSTADRQIASTDRRPANRDHQSPPGDHSTPTAGRPRLTLEQRHVRPAKQADEIGRNSESRQRSNASRPYHTADNHRSDSTPTQRSTDDPFGTGERAGSQPGGRAGPPHEAFDQHADGNRRHGGSRDRREPRQQQRQLEGSTVRSLSYDADVDRLVETLYRRLERKLRIERERKGL